MSLRLKATVVAGLVMVMTAVSAWAATPIKLVDTKLDEYHPSIVDGWLGWDADGRRDIVWIDPDGPGDPRRIPTPYSAYMGDIVLDGPRAGQVVFWQWEGQNGQIRFYDLAEKTLGNPPSGVNTTQSEESVSMSGDHLLFGRGPRQEPAPRQVVLYDFQTDSTTIVASAAKPAFYPDQVNGDYVVFTRLTSGAAQVYRYRISTGRTIKIPPAPEGRENYFGSVLADGTVFFVQGNARLCGKNTRIMRFQDGVLKTVASVPDGIELGDLNAREIDGRTHVAFRRIVCSAATSGIYEIVL